MHCLFDSLLTNIPAHQVAVSIWDMVLAAGGIVTTITGGAYGVYKLSIKPDITNSFMSKTDCSSCRSNLEKKLDTLNSKQDRVLYILGELHGRIDK